MSGKGLNWLYSFSIVICTLIASGVLLEKLSFGLGLGDLGMLIAILLFLIVSGVLVFLKSKFSKKIKKWNLIIGVLMIIGIVYFLLSITIWRGAEIPWDGNMFIK